MDNQYLFVRRWRAFSDQYAREVVGFSTRGVQMPLERQIERQLPLVIYKGVHIAGSGSRKNRLTGTHSG